MNRDWVPALVLVGMIVGDVLVSGDVPPSDSKKLSAILDGVTAAGYAAVTEVSFDDGEWEIEALKGGEPVGVRVAPLSGKVLRDHADEPHPRLPAAAKPLTAIVQGLEKGGYGPIKSAEFEAGRWEVDAFRDSIRRELIVDLDGKVVSDRRDD